MLCCQQSIFFIPHLQQVKAHTRLENRSQLVMVCQLGPKVFINCAGFIKIDTSSFGDRYVYVYHGSLRILF